MGYWLAQARAGQDCGVLTRFDARFWTVDFPRPMLASVVTTGPNGLRVDAVFERRCDMAGLIWWSVDSHDHPLLAYETSRDYRGCRLAFRWRSGGLLPLDAVYGPTLTIEGRDAGGQPRSWYVRLWNYAVGSPTDARVRLDFDALAGGFLLPGEADPVWPADIDRMFVSLVPPGYDGTDAPLAAPVEAWVELSDIACEGSGSVLTIGDVLVPPHRLRIATSYDDCYNLTPARLLRTVLQLGYRELINHYVGMSHYARLENGLAAAQGEVLAAPFRAWHADFAARAKALDYDLILSLSFELFDAQCPAAWKQRAANGDAALTGWTPPSALLSPASPDAIGYLAAVAVRIARLAQAASQRVRIQIGEPWWWVDARGRIYLYDAAAKALFGDRLVAIGDVRGELTAAQAALLDQAGGVLAAATERIVQAVRAAVPDAEALLLAYLPTAAMTPAVARALLPRGWARPAFDVLQLEDYEWVTAGLHDASARAIAAAAARLDYPITAQHYLAGFVPTAAARGQWREIATAIARARARGVAEVVLWALPQVMRDGFVWFDDEEEPVDAFADVTFPLAIGRDANVVATTSTAIVAGSGGREQRNVEWAEARLMFDAGPGIRSEDELATLIAFFRARRGPGQAFRFRDPLDDSSGRGTDDPTPFDQLVGTGDGAATRFPLVKLYGDVARRITRPVAGTVRVAVAGAETSAFSPAPLGIVVLDTAPPAGARVTAGFRFDVPVRFAEDRLEVSRATFRAGEAASVPLIEVREG